LTSTKQSINLSNIQKQGIISELRDLIRSKTELECIVSDLEKANEVTGGKKEEIEAELKGIEKKIKKVQRDLENARKDWESSKDREAEERKR
jgi:structural maintenance of chromosome 3 (chondroitin sulfate proteoglycan 6)